MADRLPLGRAGIFNQHPSNNSGNLNSLYFGQYIPVSDQLQQRPQLQWPMTMPNTYPSVSPNVNVYMTPVPVMNQQISQPTTEQQKKWYEEQQRLRGKYEKERNYQWQQQRLRDFQAPTSMVGAGHGVAGNQPKTINMDRLIQNVFGQIDTDKGPRTNNRSSVQQISHEIIQANHQTHCGQKPRDWSQLGDLSDVFETSSYSGLPAWCQEGALVPPLYIQVEEYVTRNGIIDTSLLYPVLLSSGLSRETLGQIWSLANQHTIGQLSKSELYAILAMVALAQNACQITSLGILHSIQRAPIPLLNQTSGATGVGQQVVVDSLTPAAITPVISTLNYLGDDEFDDFQCAASSVPSMNTGQLVITNVCDTKESDSSSDFSDFQQAVVTTTTTTSHDLMSTLNDNDKYNAFRMFEQKSTDKNDANVDDEFGDFLAAEQVTISVTTPNDKEDNDDDEDDEFGFMGYVSRKRSDDRPQNPINISDDFSELNIGINVDESSVKEGGRSVESQSVSSLELGFNMSRCGSVPSLDLKVVLDDDNVGPSPNGFVTVQNGLQTPIDRYSVIRNEVPMDSGSVKCDWQRCLDACHDLLQTAGDLFSEVQSRDGHDVCSEVVYSDDGEKYLRNLTEVYRICRRISASVRCSSINDLSTKLDGILEIVESDWQRMSTLMSTRDVLPSNDSTMFDFSSLVIGGHDNDNEVTRACGVCLLDVEKQRSLSEDGYDIHNWLTYGGRQYHASCANFWVNCVDSLLPALTFARLKQITFS